VIIGDETAPEKGVRGESCDAENTHDRNRKIQRELQDAPECPVEEVSKIRAVRLLAPQICAMQSKGYSLAAIAAMLSDKALP